MVSHLPNISHISILICSVVAKLSTDNISIHLIESIVTYCPPLSTMIDLQKAYRGTRTCAVQLYSVR